MARQTAPAQADQRNTPAGDSHRPARKMQPPLTPMIDVVFQLLLFFLLTTTFRPDEGVLLANLPGTRPDERVPGPDIVVELHPVGLRGVRYVMSDMSLVEDGLAPDARAVPETLYGLLDRRREQLGELADDSRVVIRAQGDVRWRYVVEAFNQAARARFKKIALGDG